MIDGTTSVDAAAILLLVCAVGAIIAITYVHFGISMKINRTCYFCLEDEGHSPTCRSRDQPDDVHVLPVFPGEREHPASVDCWCGPRRDVEEPRLVIHERRAQA